MAHCVHVAKGRWVSNWRPTVWQPVVTVTEERERGRGMPPVRKCNSLYSNIEWLRYGDVQGADSALHPVPTLLTKYIAQHIHLTPHFFLDS